MNNDLLKKLLQGLQPQDELSPQMGNSPAYEVAPNLAPPDYPSPLRTPQELEQLKMDFTNEAPDVIQGSVPKPTIKPTLPFMPKQELPVQQAEQAPVEKKASLADLLANMSKPESDNELMNKQANANDTIRNILMARAANKIGASIAGVNADEKYGQDVVDLANKDVTDLQSRRKSEIEQEDQGFKRKNQVISEQKAIFELGDKEKENDPNSDVSKAFREYARSYVQSSGSNIKIDDRMSMADLQKQMGVIGQQVQMKMSQDMRRDNMEAQRESRMSDKANKQDMKNVDFIERQAKVMRDSKNYKAAQASESLVNLLEDAIKNPSAVKEIAATYETIKTLDPDSAVREGEVGLLQQGMSYRAKLQVLASKASTNPQVYGPDFLKTMRDYADFKKQLSKKLYDKEFQGLAKIGKRRGLSDDDINVMNPMYGNEESAKTEATVTNPGEIKRKTKDGKIAIYDSNKNFLRYEK